MTRRLLRRSMGLGLLGALVSTGISAANDLTGDFLSALDSIEIRYGGDHRKFCARRHKPLEGKYCSAAKLDSWIAYAYREPLERVRAPRWAFTNKLWIAYESSDPCARCNQRALVRQLFRDVFDWVIEPRTVEVDALVLRRKSGDAPVAESKASRCVEPRNYSVSYGMPSPWRDLPWGNPALPGVDIADIEFTRSSLRFVGCTAADLALGLRRLQGVWTVDETGDSRRFDVTLRHGNLKLERLQEEFKDKLPMVLRRERRVETFLILRGDPPPRKWKSP